jgi:hypothetical protein
MASRSAVQAFDRGVRAGFSVRRRADCHKPKPLHHNPKAKAEGNRSLELRDSISSRMVVLTFALLSLAPEFGLKKD